MILMFMKDEYYSNAIGKCYNHTIRNVIDVQTNLLVCYIYPFGIIHNAHVIDVHSNGYGYYTYPFGVISTSKV
jgi:hypothetical protein